MNDYPKSWSVAHQICLAINNYYKQAAREQRNYIIGVICFTALVILLTICIMMG